MGLEWSLGKGSIFLGVAKSMPVLRHTKTIPAYRLRRHFASPWKLDDSSIPAKAGKGMAYSGERGRLSSSNCKFASRKVFRSATPFFATRNSP
jgi:hypothetical protein